MPPLSRTNCKPQLDRRPGRPVARVLSQVRSKPTRSLAFLPFAVGSSPPLFSRGFQIQHAQIVPCVLATLFNATQVPLLSFSVVSGNIKALMIHVREAVLVTWDK